MDDFRDLEVWQKSYALALQVYQVTRGFPQFETYAMSSQLQRAAVSIPTNVAEGSCRHSRAEYLRFVSIARGSAAEVETLLCLARDLSYLKAPDASQLLQALTRIRMMLTRLAQSLRQTRA